jgi:hypothetical protein
MLRGLLCGLYLSYADCTVFILCELYLFPPSCDGSELLLAKIEDGLAELGLLLRQPVHSVVDGVVAQTPKGLHNTFHYRLSDHCAREQLGYLHTKIANINSVVPAQEKIT